MEKRFLNRDLKRKIKRNIEEDVAKTIKKSGAGKELEQHKRTIESSLRRLVKKQCPDKDLNILRQYSLTEDYVKFNFIIDDGGNLLKPWYRSYGIFSFEFKKPITSQKNDKSSFLVNIADSDEELKELCLVSYKINDSLTCEIKKVTDAYADRMERFRTVKTLLAEYPKMKKYIPKIEKKKTVKPEEDKTIEIYEAS